MRCLVAGLADDVELAEHDVGHGSAERALAQQIEDAVGVRAGQSISLVDDGDDVLDERAQLDERAGRVGARVASPRNRRDRRAPGACDRKNSKFCDFMSATSRTHAIAVCSARAITSAPSLPALHPLRQQLLAPQADQLRRLGLVVRAGFDGPRDVVGRRRRRGVPSRSKPFPRGRSRSDADRALGVAIALLMSSSEIVAFVDQTRARRSAASSSRTLPGQACRRRTFFAPGESFFLVAVVSELFLLFLEDVLGEEEDVALTLPERRHLQAEHGETVVEILAEPSRMTSAARLRFVAETTRTSTAIGPRFADPDDLLLLDRAQELHLRAEGELADLVEESVPPWACYEVAVAILRPPQ